MSRFDERSFGGQVFRPKPEIHIEEDASLGIIATPWGPRSGAKKTIEILKDYVLSARQDLEATSPFQKLTCLSGLANNLRVGVMLANDTLYREENKSEYISGVEVLAFSRQEDELAFAQVGHPNLFISRSHGAWIPLGVQVDLATEFSLSEGLLPPLPQNVIGMHTTSNLLVSSIKVQPSDHLIFLSHAHVAHPFIASPFSNPSLDSISQSLIQQMPNLPFWLGVLSLNRSS